MAKEMESESGNQVEASRRRFLKTAGKIAVYTPPAMLIMSRPSYATFRKSGGYEQHSYTRHRRLSIKKSKSFFGRFLRSLFG